MIKRTNRVIMLVVVVIMMFTVIGCTSVAVPGYVYDNNETEKRVQDTVDKVIEDSTEEENTDYNEEGTQVDSGPVDESSEDSSEEQPDIESPEENDETKPKVDANGVLINEDTNLPYKIAIALDDGALDYIESYDSYVTAELRIKNVLHDDAVIVKNGDLLYVKYGLVNLGIKSTYEITEFTYNGMDYYTNGQYGHDALFVSTSYKSIQDGNPQYYMLLNGNPGLVSDHDSELIPMNWVESMSYYKVNADHELVHVYATDLTEPYHYVVSQPLNRAPSYLKQGVKYYSYDGHYFYTDFKQLVDDRRNRVTEDAVNSGAPYYNYYQYLSYRSKTNYSAAELNAYLDYVLTRRGYDATSILNGSGQYFMNAQDTFGINAALELAMALHESQYGTSSIARTKNNVFGMNATDSNPYGDADGFDTLQGGIDYHVRYYITSSYLNPDKFHYNGQALGNKLVGFNVYYASDPYWGEKVASHYYLMDKYLGFKDRYSYELGVTNAAANVYLESSIYSDVLYREASLYDYYKKGITVVILEETDYFYKILLPAPLVGTSLSPYSVYRYNDSSIGYIRKTDVDLINY